MLIMIAHATPIVAMIASLALVILGGAGLLTFAGMLFTEGQIDQINAVKHGLPHSGR